MVRSPSPSLVKPSFEEMSIRSDSVDTENPCIKNCDILVFGAKDAGKRTFMEYFTLKKMPKTPQKSQTEFLKKTITIPGTKDKINVRLWCQTSQ